MDLWDLTKLLFRRWYFALPMLLVSVLLVVIAAQSVSPDYSAKGYLQMIPPPSLGRVQDPDAKPRPANPWLDLGYDALGNAAVIAATEPSELEAFPDRGLSDSVVVLLNPGTSTLFEIEAVGSTPAQATATVREIIKRLKEEVAAAQQQYRVEQQDTITTLTLNDGKTVEVVTSKVKRVLIVAAGMGLLMTAAGTIGLDALVRRRRRSRELSVVAAGSGRPPVPGPITRLLGRARDGSVIIAGGGESLRPPNGLVRPQPARPVTPSANAAAMTTVISGIAPVSPMAPISPAGRPVSGDLPGVGAAAPISPAISAASIQYRSDVDREANGRVFGTPRPQPDDESDAEPTGDSVDELAAEGDELDDAGGYPMPPDATIVLPLAQTSWLKDGRTRR